MPGLRIGWIASQDTETLGLIDQYKHYLSICNPGPSEHLAMIALKAREAILGRNRGIVADCLKELDSFFAAYPDLFDWRHPDGGCVAFPRYLGRDGVEAFCQGLLDQEGVLLAASLYNSEVLPVPTDRFRIGCGRRGTTAGLVAMRRYLDKHHHEVRP